MTTSALTQTQINALIKLAEKPAKRKKSAKQPRTAPRKTNALRFWARLVISHTLALSTGIVSGYFFRENGGDLVAILQADFAVIAFFCASWAVIFAIAR
ncbi:MAG: hypothetical protein GY862_39235 [Gammaproteobacteria bacterium]|nr:hypothetical protein [Gammaproteobacteria bacterium]